MRKFNKGAQISRMVTLLLLISVLTGCSLFKTAPPPVTLQSNQAVKLRQNESAPFSGWLLGDEAMARILEKAERTCK